jgi:hypothetical protein
MLTTTRTVGRDLGGIPHGVTCGDEWAQELVQSFVLLVRSCGQQILGLLP